MPVTGPDSDDAPKPAWHNRPSTPLGVSAAALALLALLIGAISYVTGQANEPEPAPIDFVDPTYSVTDSSTPNSGAPGTTETITSTSPPVTTDINPEETTPTTTESGPSTITTRPPRTRETDVGPTTRERPRLTRRTTPSEEPSENP